MPIHHAINSRGIMNALDFSPIFAPAAEALRARMEATLKDGGFTKRNVKDIEVGSYGHDGCRVWYVQVHAAVASYGRVKGALVKAGFLDDKSSPGVITVRVYLDQEKVLADYFADVEAMRAELAALKSSPSNT
jgi:hypothetical protein